MSDAHDISSLFASHGHEVYPLLMRTAHLFPSAVTVLTRGHFSDPSFSFDGQLCETLDILLMLQFSWTCVWFCPSLGGLHSDHSRPTEGASACSACTPGTYSGSTGPCRGPPFAACCLPCVCVC
jgi:hypothetical protein